MSKKYDEFDSASTLKDEDLVLIAQKNKDTNKNVNALTTIGEIKASINNSLKNTVNEAINNSEVINKKINLVIGETLPETRDKNTLYFKVTENIQPTTSNEVKVSPNMGLKIEE